LLFVTLGPYKSGETSFFTYIRNITNIGLPDYHIGSNYVENVDSVADLGITVDSNLKFSLHVSNIVRKAFIRSKLIVKCFQSKDSATLVRAFKTYVLPLLQYNSPVWSPHLLKDIDLIEKVQRRFTKRLLNMSGKCYNDRLSALKLERLEALRMRTDVITAYKIIFGLTGVDCNDFFLFNNCSIATRGHDYKLLLPICHCDTRQYCFSSRVARIWNSLPAESTDFSSLKRFITSIHHYNFESLCIGKQ